MNETIIKAINVNKQYKPVKALDQVNFEIQRGQIVGLLGSNGAGKTTLIKSLLGLCTFEGDIEVLSMHPKKDRTALMEQMSFITDVAVLPRWLQVANALDFVEGVHPRFDRAKAEALLDQTEIQYQSKVHELSKGMIVQLHLALVMAIDADILVLDEPTLGLDIMYRKLFYRQLLSDFYDKNRTIIIATHQIDEVENILDHVIMMNHGKIVLHDSLDNLQQQYCHVTVPKSKVEKARQLGPLDELTRLGDVQFLFENIDNKTLRKLGECKTVPVSDIFVAKMRKQ